MSKAHLQLRPMGDLVFIERLKQEEVTKSGIILARKEATDPRDKSGRLNQGIVIGVGPGKISDITGIRLPMAVKIGDKVLFNEYEIQEFPVGNVVYLGAHEDDLCAVIE